MKRLILSVVFSLFLAGFAQAEELNIKEVVDKVPPVKTGIAYSVVENKINFLAVFPVYTYGKFTLNTGYAGAQPTTGHKAIVSADYELYNPENVETGNALLNKLVNAVDIRPGIWVGAGRIEKDEPESDWGISVVLLNAKFY